MESGHSVALMEHRREFFRQGLHTLYLPIYDHICENLTEAWQPYRGWCTIAAQDALYSVGRTLPGAIVTRARGGESPHNYGCATDWTYWVAGKPVWMKLDDTRWVEFHQACRNAGARLGADFKSFPDFPHNELAIKIPWAMINQHRISQGQNGALTFIQENAA